MYGGRGGPFCPGDNTTAHLLGGCRMAATTADGVVNHRGEVFDVTSGHDGPLLTITTLVERIADLMLRDPRNAARFQSPEVVR